MSASNNEISSPRSKLSSFFFGELMDSIIVDMASEYHRIARLGLDCSTENDEEDTRLSKQAREADPTSTSHSSGGATAETTGGSKYVVDIFGQTHPAVASEIFECMNCGRSIAAGRFAPHLEKCMGKGRKARQKVTRSSTITQSRNSRGSPVTVYAPQSNDRRTSNGGRMSGEDFTDFSFDDA